MANKKILSLLDEIEQILPGNDKMRLIESKGDHIITSAINFLRLINETFEEEEANKLTKHFFLAIKNQDSRRFDRLLRKKS